MNLIKIGPNMPESASPQHSFVPEPVFFNENGRLRDDLLWTIKRGSKLRIAAACFSMNAFEILKSALTQIDELHFLFTSPTFTSTKEEASRREFFIPRRNREQSLYGTEFEVKLRNELTQKAIARECAEWIKQKVRFKSVVSNAQSQEDSIVVVDGSNITSYSGSQEFTLAGLGCADGASKKRANIIRFEAPNSKKFLDLFESGWNNPTSQDVTAQIVDNISTVYAENSPDFIYFVALYNIFHEFLEDLSQDALPNEATGYRKSVVWNKLYNFQKDAAYGVINKLNTYNGCILADSVGLGKTFTALAVIKYFESRNQNALVLCPKRLSDNWTTYKSNYVDNPLCEDKLRYDVLAHTDLSRRSGYSNGNDLARINWQNYDLLVIDESHNFRNGVKNRRKEEKETRYSRLLNEVLAKGVKTKVLMLSATPVNTNFNDLKNQLQLAYVGNSEEFDRVFHGERPVEEIFRRAQTAFKSWSKLPPQERTTPNLLKALDFDFFRLLDSTTIARSRKHIQQYYDMRDVGKFPERLPPKSYSTPLTTDGKIRNELTYQAIFEKIISLKLEVYSPASFIQPSQRKEYPQIFRSDKFGGASHQGRELGIRRLMGINLLKRLESSLASFRKTLDKLWKLIENRLALLDEYDRLQREGDATPVFISQTIPQSSGDLDDEEEEFVDECENEEGDSKNCNINLEHIDRLKWRQSLQDDLKTLNFLIDLVGEIPPEQDAKLNELLKLLDEKIERPINATNRKALIFTAFKDTAEYIYERVSRHVLKKYGLKTALVTGGDKNQTTATLPRRKKDMATILTCFSPRSKDRALLLPDATDTIDVLIATDCISEGQNLQDCDFLVNYDIHWNPVRIIQRFGRIDRIGSPNAAIQLVNFWPDMPLDEYIQLKPRVEARMKIVDLSATGSDNPLDTEEERYETEFRKKQLEELKNRVCDLEEMSAGVSIVDLGINDFRLDLVQYVKDHEEAKNAPPGLHAVVPAAPGFPPGALFILKNRSQEVNRNNRNPIHPFYMVYIAENGAIQCGHLEPKSLLDAMRLLCRDKKTPIRQVYAPFNEETQDGRDMSKVSALLTKAINSIVEERENENLDLLFSPGGTTSATKSAGRDDFELVCFLVVKDPKEQGGE